MKKLGRRFINRVVALSLAATLAVVLFLVHRWFGLIGCFAVIIAWHWAGKSGIDVFDNED